MIVAVINIDLCVGRADIFSLFVSDNNKDKNNSNKQYDHNNGYNNDI